MNISTYFVNKPIFASVLSIFILIVGLIALPKLPITEYPEVVPPQVLVTASYPGANPKVIAQTVATPLEEAISGVDGLLYTSSQSTADGKLTLTATFAIGSNPDLVATLVQNRVQRAIPKLPQVVQRQGVITEKSSPDLTLVVHLTSPSGQYDMLYLSNYAELFIKEQLGKLSGVSRTVQWGAGQYSMRVWLDPQRMASLALNPSDVIQAIETQNRQVAAGSLGAQPSTESQFQLLVNLKGQLENEAQFANIIVRIGTNGEIIRLKDIAKIQIGANHYAMQALLDNEPAVAIGVFQSPDANALNISSEVRATMDKLSERFPEGLSYKIAYDPTVFVRASIDSVITTLLEAVVLVVLVVVLFLQTWRASIIPLVAVPVSIIGTFAFMYLLGFTINALTLFGLVLAIGIVVDDAIVVVENVERSLSQGLSRKAATIKAMSEVTRPIIATTLVLAAVFIPTAFLSGLTGQFYQQFAITITISTVISAFNSLTLSPALAAVILQPHSACQTQKTNGFSSLINHCLFTPFNQGFKRLENGYELLVKTLITHASKMMLIFALLILGAWYQFKVIPSEYIPSQDKIYLVSFAQLPSGASLDRTEKVVKEMSDYLLAQPGIKHTVAFPGLNINGFTLSPSSAVVFAVLDSFDDRNTSALSANAIAARANRHFSQINDAVISIFPPPPVNGLGTVGGQRIQILDKANSGDEKLHAVLTQILAEINASPQLSYGFSSYQAEVPQIDMTLDRTKAMELGVNPDELFISLQTLLGSIYVNDFSQFGKNYQVIVQAHDEFRQSPEQISQFEIRNRDGNMVPFSAFLTLANSAGPDRVMHYDGYPTAEINLYTAPGYSSDEAKAAMEAILDAQLPPEFDYSWTELTYQQMLAGDDNYYMFPLIVVLVFLVLSAQYESIRLPFAIILIIPCTLFSAFIGVQIYGGNNNIFTQIGLIVLVGLATKNAILIVEFAKELEQSGHTHLDAILRACKLRLRPILMTSLAFIMGVLPLVLATGAGAEMRQAMGVAVFSGMIGVTIFGLIFTPVFYHLFAKKHNVQTTVQAPKLVGPNI